MTRSSSSSSSSSSKIVSSSIRILIVVTIGLLWVSFLFALITRSILQEQLSSLFLPTLENELKYKFTRQKHATPDTSPLPHPEPPEHKKHCLTFDGEINRLVHASDQIFIVMPTKAAGTSLRIFVNSKCMKYRPNDYVFNAGWRAKRSFLQDVYETPRVLASHVKGNELASLIQQMTRNSLLIYIHREETDRIISAVRHVVDMRLCSDEQVWKRTPLISGRSNDSFITRNGTQCIITDDTLFKHVITHHRRLEIGQGAPDALTCDLYDAIQQHAPKMMFMHFTQADRLMEVIAAKHCPNEKPFHANDNKNTDITSMVNLTRSGKLVELRDWLEKKRYVLEWALDLKQEATCQAKTRKMEDILFSCSDETVGVEFLK